MREFNLTFEGSAIRVVLNADGTFSTPEIHSGQGTGLKPAHEPIIMARKPLIGTVAANVAKHGTGAINIDATRIGTTDSLNGGAYSGEQRKRENYTSTDAGANTSLTSLQRGIGEYTQPTGRWPSNVLLDEHAAAELDEQSEGTRASKPSGAHVRHSTGAVQSVAKGKEYPREGNGHADRSGGASRFFFVAKPSRAERDLGCEHLPERTGGEATDREDGSAGTMNPRAGAGRTGGARNYHPTVKPIALMRYLVRLVTPPGGTVIDPFCGSGTTGIASRLEQREFIGIEREPDFVEIALARIAGGAP